MGAWGRDQEMLPAGKAMSSLCHQSANTRTTAVTVAPTTHTIVGAREASACRSGLRHNGAATRAAAPTIGVSWTHPPRAGAPAGTGGLGRL